MKAETSRLLESQAPELIQCLSQHIRFKADARGGEIDSTSRWEEWPRSEGGEILGLRPLCILRFVIIYMAALEPGHTASHTL